MTTSKRVVPLLLVLLQRTLFSVKSLATTSIKLTDEKFHESTAGKTIFVQFFASERKKPSSFVVDLGSLV